MSASSDPYQLELKVKTDKEVRFWTVLEREINQEIPEHLKVVLKLTKFDNLLSLSTEFYDWHRHIEDFMTLSISKLDKKDLDMLKDYYFNGSFKFPPGDAAFLTKISSIISKSFDRISQALRIDNVAEGRKRAKRN